MPWQDLFPFTTRINQSNHLELGGCDATELVREYGAPLYVFDETTLRAQATRAHAAFESHWSDVTILYATKAYFAPFLARLFNELGLGLDVTSAAEIEIARRAGFSPDTIYVHGNNKTPEEIRAAFKFRISHLVIDNLDEIPVVAALAQEYKLTPQLLIRLSPNVDAHTHRYMTTGVADSKFGLGIANGAAEAALTAISRFSQLELVGLHFHIGSQVFDTESLRDALSAVLNVASDWQTRFGFQLRELDLGGGWGVAYNETQTSLDVEAFAENTTHVLREALRERGMDSNLKLLVEPGRALVARAGVALYRVGSVKTIPGVRDYVAVDGGMGDNVRPALYGARYSAFLANRPDAEATHQYTIAGRYCEQGDLLIEASQLPETHVGDVIAIPVAGAYQLPMASNYNLIPRPAVVLVNEGKAKLVRRRETIDDLLSCDL